jgi:release factor glutamine methyltransferase
MQKKPYVFAKINKLMKENSINNFVEYATEKLERIYDEKEAKAIALALMADILQMKQAEVFMYYFEPLALEKVNNFNKLLDRLKQNEPLQYVLGKVEFDDLELIIRPPVLIPRPETEELFYKTADRIESYFNKGEKLSILDIGCGSACLSLALKKRFPQATITAVDIEEEALALAKENAAKLHLDIQVEKMDILQQIPNGDFDVIISNPPYIRESEKELMQKNVLDFESETALFVPDNDALLFYKRIAFLAEKLLKTEGLIALEINEALAAETAAVFSAAGFKNIETNQDFRDKARFLFAEY